MIRTQVQLTEEQAASLKRLASKRGVSMAELIRQALARQIREDEEEWEAIKARALSVIGKYHDTVSDVSVNHDKYLEEAYGDWLPRVR